ncbi:MAG: DNA mismatch repair endonuclease MutL [Candidatus Methylacidiphilales bacterium]
MNRIHLLPDKVANQIAAGEVIERPASVIKELVENSLDAGATQVDVVVRSGGRTSLLVTDNGCGMSRDDALLCLERHATSKIRDSNDLSKILSYGFRGEAIPSIASVAKFRLRSRERLEVAEAQASGTDVGVDPSPDAAPSLEDVAGVEIIMDGGKLLDVRQTGMAPGTQIEARSIFFNMPARRKFLRTVPTEEAHIRQQMILFGLARPEVGFTLTMDDAPPQRWPQSQTLRERAAAIYGRSWVDATVPLQCENRRLNLRISGLIGKAGISRPSRHEEHLFVNKRAVVNRTLQYALLEGYHNSLMRGRYPIAVLFLEMDPAGVDVNIHPAKREVRFHDDAQLRGFVVHAIQDALREGMDGPVSVSLGTAETETAPAPREEVSPWLDESRQQNASAGEAEPAEAIPQSDGNAAVPLGEAEPEQAPKHSETDAVALTQPGHRPEQPVAPTVQREPAIRPLLPERRVEAGVRNTTETMASRKPAPSTPQELTLEHTPEATSENDSDGRQASFDLPTTPRPMRAPQAVVQRNRLDIRVIGDIAHTYLIGESPEGMVLIDQHAAHERILFEQMLKRLGREEILAQRLLLPATFSLPPRDSDFLREQLPTLNRIGIGISLFGPNTFLVDALPPMVRTRDIPDFMRSLVIDLQESGGETRKMRRASEETVAKTVCRHAIKANDILRPDEWEQLLVDLLKCDLPYTCPHGRPTMILMTRNELERKFGRAG